MDTTLDDTFASSLEKVLKHQVVAAWVTAKQALQQVDVYRLSRLEKAPSVTAGKRTASGVRIAVSTVWTAVGHNLVSQGEAPIAGWNGRAWINEDHRRVSLLAWSIPKRVQVHERARIGHPTRALWNGHVCTSHE